jgi:hypothetical protein
MMGLMALRAGEEIQVFTLPPCDAFWQVVIKKALTKYGP